MNFKQFRRSSPAEILICILWYDLSFPQARPCLSLPFFFFLFVLCCLSVCNGSCSFHHAQDCKQRFTTANLRKGRKRMYPHKEMTPQHIGIQRKSAKPTTDRLTFFKRAELQRRVCISFSRFGNVLARGLSAKATSWNVWHKGVMLETTPHALRAPPCLF